FSWIVFFVITLMNQFGVIIELYSASPYFALYMGAMLLTVFLKTLISPVKPLHKAGTFAAAFAVMMATRVTALFAELWRSGDEIGDYTAELLYAIAANGGLLYFVNPLRIYGEVTRLVSLETWLPEVVALAVSGAIVEAVTIALPAAAVIEAITWWLARRRERKETQEREREEAERLENEQRAYEHAEIDRLGRAKNLLERAYTGDAAAQHEMGMLYVGNGTLENAVPWLQIAADNGDTQSKYELGKIYYEGREDIAQDIEKAYALLKEAAIADHTEAQFLLGCLHFGAEVGGTPDYSEAALWFGKAAGDGHAKSMGMLAQIHTMGDEFPEADAHLAIKLMKKLAHEHNDNEDMPLDVLYYNGLNVQEETKLERAWERRSNGKKQRDAVADEITAELYWLNESIKQKRKFLHDYADNWDWRNEETQKSLKEDILRSRELADELDDLVERKSNRAYEQH
ncbi:MAG: sel1 repeat family protein, partial [Defluviitaleaceae bacterium]|nr:sel1 repeat family protein [Defluviitaleaceae bacterium]